MTRHNEALSEGIDKLNEGRSLNLSTSSADSETMELLEVAVLLKQSDLQTRPPKHVLDAVVKSAASGFHAQKKTRSSAWLYSGVAGAAAAALLFFGIHGFPAWQIAPTEPSAPVAVSTQTPPNQPSISNPVDVPNTRISSPSPPASSSSAASPTPAAPAASPSTPRAATAPKNIPPNDSAADRYSTAPSAPAGGVTTKSIQLPPPPASTTAPAAASTPVALTLPNQKPDSVSTDLKTGVIRQIYAAGTPSELVITQRPLSKEKDAAPSQNKSIALREADIPKSDTVNRVVVIIQNQEVFLEGRKTQEELLELAKTLK